MLGKDTAEKHAQVLARAKPVVGFDIRERKGLIQRKTTARTIRSTRLGTEMKFFVESAVNKAGRRVVPEEFRRFAPKGCSFSFDTICDVTLMHYLDNKQRLEIQRELPFYASTGSISGLYKKGLGYFKACHEAAIPELVKLLKKKNTPYIWQFDGTNEGGKNTLFQVMEASSGLVIFAKKIPTENQIDIENLLKDIAGKFGRPDVIIADMSGRGIAAVKSLWGDKVSIFICQFHFLRDIGKDLLMEQHESLRKCFSRSNISANLNALRKRILTKMKDSPEEAQHCQSIVDLIDWIGDYKSELKGEGTPFDLKWKNYFQRCKKAHVKIAEILAVPGREYHKYATKFLGQLKSKLAKLTNDKSSRKCYQAVLENSRVFTEIRQIFREDKQDKSAPLSRNVKASAGKSPDQDDLLLQQNIQAMADKLKLMSEQAKGKNILRYSNAAKQLETHKAMLGNYVKFEGEYHALPRTNNLCEVSFRDVKTQVRRTSGKKNLSRILDSTPAEIMLLQNLRNKDYLRIVFKGKEIHEAFADISEGTIKSILIEMNKQVAKRNISPVIKQKNFLVVCKNELLKIAI